MKKTLLTLALALTSVCAMASMSTSKMRNYARFLSDRMAYELDFTAQQYDDCYEINLDFLYAVNRILDDVAWGYSDAIMQYYEFLDYRNDDLRYIMTTRQYMKFIAADYFYRPIYTYNRTWGFRIYTIYSNSKFFYYDAPSIYKTYNGFHSRNHYSSSYYIDRYKHYDHYTDPYVIKGSDKYDHYRKNDFGANIKNRNGNKYDINDYNNKNQSDRTKDYRYQDNSGNKNTHEINNRNNKNNGTTQQSNSNGAVTHSNGNTSVPTKESGTTRTGNRNGSTPATRTTTR